jgi:S-disulfanyl-L-cysteine oxidoreductase SoxD
MHRLLTRVCLPALVLGCLNLTAAAQSSNTERRTIWNGIYTDVQAERGRTAYAGACARCHLEDFSGKNGPSLKGDRFIENWREANLNILFNTVKSMPPTNSNNPPPRLPDPMYVDIVAHILKGNGAPAGSQELTLDALPQVQFEKKTGPEPVPNLSLISVIGCVEQPNPGVWNLTRGTEPVRTMAPDEVLPNESRSAQTLSFGDKSYRLSQIDRLGGTFETNTAKKILVKGALVRQSDRTERINITAFAPIAEQCN